MKGHLKVHIALFIVTLIYAATFTIAKEVMPAYIKPAAFILLRVLVAAVCIFAFHRFTVNEKVRDRGDFKKLFACGMFGVAFNMLFFFKGLSITSPINGAVLMMNTPIFVVVFAALLLKEKLTLQKATGILIAAFGAIMLMGGRNFTFNSETYVGDLFVITNAIIYAFYLVYAKALMHKYHPLTVTLWSFVFGLLIVIPFGIGDFVQIGWESMPQKIWWYVVFITIGCTFLTYVLSAYALRKASSSLVGSYIYLQPVMAVIIALLSGRDTLSSEKVMEIVVIFIGVFLVNYSRKKAEPKIILNE